MEYSYLLIILIMKFFQTYSNKKSSVLVSGFDAYLQFGAFRYLLCALLAFFLLVFSALKNGVGLFSGGISAPALYISLIAALAFAVSFFCSLSALKSGAMALVSLAGSAGLLIPCVCGIFLFNEPMSVWQFGGIALLMVSAFLLAGYSKRLNGSFSWKTALLLAGSMLSNGAIMMAQKLYSKYVENGDAAVFSFLSFLFAGIFFLIIWFIALAAGKRSPRLMGRALAGYGAVNSGALLVINQLATVAAAVIPSAILFSVNDGGGTIITAVTAAVFFREKLTPRAIAGIAVGIAALLVINIL